jgi:hypothetical protein
MCSSFWISSVGSINMMQTCSVVIVMRYDAQFVRVCERVFKYTKMLSLCIAFIK